MCLYSRHYKKVSALFCTWMHAVYVLLTPPLTVHVPLTLKCILYTNPMQCAQQWKGKIDRTENIEGQTSTSYACKTHTIYIHVDVQKGAKASPLLPLKCNPAFGVRAIFHLFNYMLHVYTMYMYVFEIPVLYQCEYKIHVCFLQDAGSSFSLLW